MSAEEFTEHFGLFPVVVQSARHPEGERLNEQLLAEIENLRQITPNSRLRHSASTAYTTIQSCNNLHSRTVFEELVSFLLQELEVFAKYQSIKFDINGIIIKDCWFNIYGPSTFIEAHNHPNSVFTGVYYIKVPEGSANIVLESELSDQMLRTPISKANEYNVTTKSITPTPGLLVLFNSNIMHRTQLHKPTDERISISFTVTL